MGLTFVVLCSLAYISLLFYIAWREDRRAEQGKSVVRNPYIYALSLAVYCTAWTFFGSVGRVTTGGMSFLAIYIGPTLMAPLWYFVLRKMVLISKNQRITSIADFVSARYGKSSVLAVLVTCIAVIGILPYISIQIRAVTFGITTLTHFGEAPPTGYVSFWLDSGLWVTLAMACFTMIFGTRKLDPSEKHEGLVSAIAFESIVKLLAFILLGLFVTFGLYNGFGDLFEKALSQPHTARLFSLQDSGISALSWNILCLLSLFAIILLPRQFHVAVVENTDPRHLLKAMWVFPLYLLLINVFVFPVALAGIMIFGSSINPDTYVLSLPLSQNMEWLALLVFLGGFSAATGMVVVESTALSIMFSNHLVVPWLIRSGRFQQGISLVDGAARLLDIRRICILLILLLAYSYQKVIGGRYDLVSVGLISFTAAAQLAPVVLGALYWRRATHQGAVWGLVAGFFLWTYCLPLPSLAQAGIIDQSFVHQGPWGLGFLRPYALFGLTGLDPITHATFWSLLFNAGLFAFVSVNTKPSALNLTQADLFINIEKYISGQDADIWKREAKIGELRALLHRFLGETRAQMVFEEFETNQNVSLQNKKIVQADFINFAETHLAGAIGAASARLVMDSVVKEEPITLQEIIRILEQTKEAVAYTKMVEAKNAELNALTEQLTTANEQLKALDRLKADFITTVTHELRTPVTSIRSLSKIILDYADEIEETRKKEYLQILVHESERISRLINQVLDIEKIESESSIMRFEPLDFFKIVTQSVAGMKQLFEEKNVSLRVHIDGEATPAWIRGDEDRLIQVVINLLSNALKFCAVQNGIVAVHLQRHNDAYVLRVQDNGDGIPKDKQSVIFQKFTQLQHNQMGKPQGTGLGLYIVKSIVERHKGSIRLESKKGQGTTFIIQLPVIDDRHTSF